MLFHVSIAVRIPHDADPEKIKVLGEREHERAKELQQQGKWLHLWRVAGKFANISIFDVESPGGTPRDPELASTLSVHGGRRDGSVPAPRVAGITQIRRCPASASSEESKRTGIGLFMKPH